MKGRAVAAALLIFTALTVFALPATMRTADAVPPNTIPSYDDLFQSMQSIFEQATEAATQQGGNSDSTPEADPIIGIEVRGAVGNPFVANPAEYIEKAPMMSFRDVGSFKWPMAAPAAQRADVQGFRLVRLIQDARIADGVDTITFISATGQRVSMPLLAVMQPYASIVAPADDSAAERAGFTNQLWLESVSGTALMQDIVAIELTVG